MDETSPPLPLRHFIATPHGADEIQPVTLLARGSCGSCASCGACPLPGVDARLQIVHAMGCGAALRQAVVTTVATAAVSSSAAVLAGVERAIRASTTHVTLEKPAAEHLLALAEAATHVVECYEECLGAAIDEICDILKAQVPALPPSTAPVALSQPEKLKALVYVRGVLDHTLARVLDGGVLHEGTIQILDDIIGLAKKYGAP